MHMHTQYLRCERLQLYEIRATCACLECCDCMLQNHQIELLKDEVTAKDAALVKEHFGHVRAEQECDSLRTEGDQVRWHNSRCLQALFGNSGLANPKHGRTMLLAVTCTD